MRTIRSPLGAVLVALALVASIQPGSAAAQVTIDFNDGTSGSAIGSFYSALGVTFSNARWGGLGNLAGADGLTLTAITSGYQPQPTSPIVAMFSSAISSFSLRGIDLGANGMQFDAYDATAGGSLIGSASAFGTAAGVGNWEDLTVSGSGIRRVEVYQPATGYGDGVLFDNMAFTQGEVVPEPATVALMLTGLVGIGAVAVRRRREEDELEA